MTGLALALDVFGAVSGLGAQARWANIGAGVAFALAASALFWLALVSSSPLLNVEPVAALVMACALLVVGAVVALGVAGMRPGMPR